MERKRGPGIRVPPPAIFIAAFLIGVFIEAAFIRLRFVDGAHTPLWLTVTGYTLLAAGVTIAVWGVVTFRRHHTSVLPFRAASALVQSGPYRFTRNPMYLGMTLGHFGGSLVLNAIWPLILLPIALVVLSYAVIRKEERHLAENFTEYGEYRARVRRWL